MRQHARRPGEPRCPNRHPPQRPGRGRAPGAKMDTALPTRLSIRIDVPPSIYQLPNQQSIAYHLLTISQPSAVS